MSFNQWYTGSNHPLHGLVYMSNLETELMLNPKVLDKIKKSLPAYFLRIEPNGTLSIQMSSTTYHSLYNECIINVNMYVLQHIKRCPPTIIHFIIYSIVKEEQERRRLAAAI
jgi:hypothetical protein